MSPTAERDLVRELARQVAEFAGSSEMKAVRKRWRDVNALRRPDRAPVWCRPVGAWREILPEESLSCQDPALRDVEREFRKILHKKNIGDDTPVEPCFEVDAVLDVEPANTWGLEVGHHRASSTGGAWGYDPPLKTEADFEKLRLPRFTYNQARTGEKLARAGELLGDILPVKLVCGAPLGATLGTDAAELRGLEQMMMDMIAEPRLAHRLMAHLRDATLAFMNVAESAGLVVPNNTGPMTASDPLGPEPADGRCTFANCWCMANSQEFDQVSPAMWEEFCLAYQQPILERHGLVAYGCCENLTHKIDGVLSIPNLRIFVCSAWTDLDIVLEKVSADYCIMWRQKASEVVFADDLAGIKQDLEEGARKLRGRPYQIVLRELETLSGHPDRLHAWTELAREAAAKYA